MDRLNRRDFATLFTGLAGLVLMSGCATPEPERPVAVVSTEPPPLLVLPDRPDRYVVGPDDNIWDISARYLDEPWRWGELWPGGDWPSIYPGDVLQYDATQGQLQLAEGEPPTIKLTPQVRVEYIHDPVPTVTREGVLSFYDDSVVLSDNGWKQAPYIVGGSDNRPLLASGNAVYARGAEFDRPVYGVYRPEGEYRHPDTNDFLGYNMVYLGQAELEDVGDPSTLRLAGTRREVRPGDRLLEAVGEDRLEFDFTTVPAPPDTYGRILGALGKEPTLLGRYDVVVVTLGDLDGMRQGSVLASYATDAAMSDPLTGATVDSPRERSGLIVLFKVFERASYGLVTEARREIRPGDLVREP